mmetsp:Transcript_28816/g.32297  ORF Transcript_28816/g.32297 Transcript_28816/m.32297 type:complete len:786 (+) Transcript_28816:249-2606(+)
MPNSIIIDDDDDSSSTLSAREEFLLVLVSSMLESSGQMKNQKRALMILETCGVQPEVLDAADPANDIVREELFEMSGIRGVFPQFFLVQGDQTSFFANFMELDSMNEDGILEEWLNMEFPSVKVRHTPVNADAGVSVDAHAHAHVSNELKHDATEYDRVQNTSTTTDILNATVTSDTKILKSTHYVSDDHHHKQQLKCEERKKISSIPTVSTQEEWSDPLLLERYEDEILALENFLEKREQNEGQQNIQKNNKQAIANEEDKDERVRAEHEVPSSTNRENNRDGKRSFHNKISKQHIISSADAAMDNQQIKQEEDTLSECFYEVIPKLQSMQSLISSDDDTAETTATKSSILTTNRILSCGLDLRIQPETDLHFWLNDETPRCTITLSNISSSCSPLAFKINPSENRRYMVHPIVGIIKPQATVPITVFLLDEAKENLLSMFQKLESTAEFQQNDELSIEWCVHHPTNYCNKLTGNYDQDFDTLLSYWNSARNNDSWSSGKSFLPIKINNADEKGYDNISTHRHRQLLHLPPLSPSTATTATITPTSSSSPSSRSRGKHHQYSTKNYNSSSLLQSNNDYNNNNKDIPINVSMETFSSRSETEQLLQAEVEGFRQKCEELTAERYIVEGQLKEAREKEERSLLSRCNGRLDDDVVHKSQLQQMMRCGYCLKVFKSTFSSLNAPIASNACGHSICRNCCHERLSSSRKVRRLRQNENMDSSERLRRSISRDLFMCVGDINQVCSSFDDENVNDISESCPICNTPKAFRHGKLHVNESLCVVLKLLEC